MVNRSVSLRPGLQSEAERLQERCDRLTFERDDLENRFKVLAGIYLADRFRGVVGMCVMDERERERHQQFAELRHGKSELFDASPELVAHIALVRETFGDPARFLVA